jgi:hypothetical protein
MVQTTYNKKSFWEEEALRLHSIAEVVLADNLTKFLLNKGYKEVTLSVISTRKGTSYRLEGRKSKEVCLVKRADSLEQLESSVMGNGSLEVKLSDYL